MVLSSDKRDGETMMEVAESYMGELVYKSMVQVKYEDDTDSQRKFKSCRLHDLMRDLSISLAKEEQFFEVVNPNKVNDYQPDRSMEVKSSSTRQLVFYFDGEGHESIKGHPFRVNKYNQGRARSVLLFANNRFTTITGSHVVAFRLIRVFALGGVRLDITGASRCLFIISLENVLGRLVHLRYLSLRGNDLLMFPSIKNLELLQTLKFDTHRRMYMLSGNIHILSRLGHLQHLYLPESEFHYLGTKLRKNIKLRFDGLSKLETVENFDTRWCEVKDLPQLISLQKLKLKVKGYSCDVEEMIKYLSSYSGKYLAVHITMCDPGSENGADMWRLLFWNHKYNLRELLIRNKLPELGQIFGQQIDNTSFIDVSLICVTMLYLRGSSLLEDPMPVLEKIPTLRVLELSNAYVGMEMVCSATGFPKLTHLDLLFLPNLEKWRVEEGSMPILQYLEIYYCRKLKELPEGLQFLSSLQRLKLGMHSGFCDRVRVVNGEQGPDLYKVAHISALEIYDR